MFGNRRWRNLTWLIVNRLSLVVNHGIYHRLCSDQMMCWTERENKEMCLFNQSNYIDMTNLLLLCFCSFAASLIRSSSQKVQKQLVCFENQIRPESGLRMKNGLQLFNTSFMLLSYQLTRPCDRSREIPQTVGFMLTSMCTTGQVKTFQKCTTVRGLKIDF